MNLTITPETLPSGFCPATLQEMWNMYAAHGTVVLPDTGVQFEASSSKPTDTTVIWLQLDSLGRPVRLYFFAQGAWLSLHPQVPGQCIIWAAALPTFTTFDGGDANAASAISGPMWEQLTAVNGRFPIGVGTTPAGTVVAQGGTGGAESATVPLPAHTHNVEFKGGGGSGADAIAHTNDTNGTFSAVTSSAGVSPATLSLIPPYYGIYILRRTSRLFFTVT